MNDLYNETIERNGKTYYYDPDMDIYYYREGPISTFDKYAWIVVVLLLSIIAIYLENR